MTLELEIRTPKREEESSLNDLFNEVFQTSRDMEEFNWKFNPPAQLKRIPPAYVAFQDGKMVGSYGIMSWELNFKGNIIPVMQPCDVCLLPDYRAQGIYQKIYREYQRHGDTLAPLAFGFPTQKAYEIGRNKMGYKAQAATILYQRHPTNIPLDTDILISTTTTVPEDWSPYAQNYRSRIGITTNRTLELMRWRYQSFPYRKERLLTYRDSTINGLAVYYVQGDTVKIYDLMAGSSRILQGLVSAIEVQNPDKRMIYGTTETAPYQDILMKMGFEVLERGVLVTSLLDTSQRDSTYSRIRQSNKWYATLADTDH